MVSLRDLLLQRWHNEEHEGLGITVSETHAFASMYQPVCMIGYVEFGVTDSISVLKQTAISLDHCFIYLFFN